ncbi:AmmeMemoRadiSam system radical SAM enzyme [Desulfocurvibacter africanus]|uniref:AmmeMemoRadiSam system radical SAM enzyme n=1 Tax=Desulfocurvibacter africanus TaxID=873 RepID=UPI002FD9370F
MIEAQLWKPAADKHVRCELCNHFCLIEQGARGKCGVRENHDGRLMSLSADKVAAMNLDPIEKKPLYHFLPGTTSLSIGTPGCTMACQFCQNYSLSMPPKQGDEVRGERITPEVIVETALRYGAASISYTYSEPTIFFELAEPCAKLAIDKGLKNVWVSNGYMSDKCLDRLRDIIHAANIDLKAFNDDFYRNICDARLKPVLKNIVSIKKMGWWLELTTLLIPGMNDSDEELRGMAAYIRDDVGADTPWHISRFHPTYKLTTKPITPVERLERAWEIGKEAGLKYVYVGNVPGHVSDHTTCPECGCLCLDRSGFSVTSNAIKDGKCPQCGLEIPGVGLSGEAGKNRAAKGRTSDAARRPAI